jgi:hypothetical protein
MEVLLGEAELLDHGAHGPVEDEDALLGELFECLHRTVVHQRIPETKKPHPMDRMRHHCSLRDIAS